VVKNGEACIQEWLAFHIHSGVQHFYLHLNIDDEGTAAALDPFWPFRPRYVQAGFVTAEVIQGEGIQGKAYDFCLQKVKQGQLAEWVAFFDVDEYLLGGNHSCSIDYLQHLDDRASSTVNWRTFSHSNNVLQVPPDRLLIEANMHTRADSSEIGMDHHIKSIVNVNRTVSCTHPHFCLYEEGW